MHNEELRQWLESYIAKHPHHPTAVLSRSQFIGFAKRALDAYLAGTYFVSRGLFSKRTKNNDLVIAIAPQSEPLPFWYISPYGRCSDMATIRQSNRHFMDARPFVTNATPTCNPELEYRD